MIITALSEVLNYVFNIKGTPGYFPKHYEFDEITEWLPKIHANDTYSFLRMLRTQRKRYEQSHPKPRCPG